MLQFRKAGIFLAIFLLTTLGVAWAQESGTAAPKPAELKAQTIGGTVKSSDGAVLPGAEVKVKETGVTVVTNERGVYTLSGISAAEITLVVSMVGFQTQEVTIQMKPDVGIVKDVILEVAELTFEMIVSAETPKLMQASESIGVVTVSPLELSRLPRLGESDVFRSLQLIPGISASNEASSGLYVRGGTPDQNLVLFDGFTAYDVDHFFGIFSAFNSNAVEKVSVYKGGFESKYGGRLSSVLDAVGKSRFPERAVLGGGASFLSYNTYMATPVGSKGALLLAGRKSYQSPFSDHIRETYSPVSGGPGGPGGPGGADQTSQPKSTFYDVNGKFVYNQSASDDFSLSFYKGSDELDNSREIGQFNSPRFDDRQLSGSINNLLTWGNTGASFNWNHRWSPNIVTNLVAAHSKYTSLRDRTSKITTVNTSSAEAIEITNGSREDNAVKDYTVGLHNIITYGRNHTIETGFQASRLSTDYGFSFQFPQRIDVTDDTTTTDTTDTTPDSETLTRRSRANQYSVYLQDTWAPTRRLSITPGVRAEYFDRTKKWYGDPRLAVNFHLTDRLKLKAAGGYYHQYARNLTREDLFQGNQDFWTLSDDVNFPVGRATHAIAGVSYERPSLLFDVEAYRKNLRGLSEFVSVNRPAPPPRGVDPADLPKIRAPRFDFESLIYSGTGVAKGVEFLVQKKTGAHTGWLTYTFGSVRSLFPLFSSSSFPASHDSTHEAKLVDTYRWKKFIFSGSMIFATGKPFTEATGTDPVILADGRTFDVVHMGTKNGIRLPDYHRLDLSAEWDFYRGESSRASAGVSVFNVYDRANVWRREYDLADGDIISTDVTYLGRTISAFMNFHIALPEPDVSAGPAWNIGTSVPGPPRRYKADRQFDFYGVVESIDPSRLVVSTKKGQKSFQIDRATVKGSEFKPGALVHVYYKLRGDQYIVTSVFQKIKDWDDVPTEEADTTATVQQP